MKHIGILAAVLMAGSAFAADEFTVDARLRVVNGNFDLTRQVNGYAANQTTSRSDYGIKAITTATNAIGCVNVTTPYYCWFRNTGSSNVFVTVTLKLRTGDVALLPASTTNISAYVAAGTGALEYWVNQQ